MQSGPCGMGLDGANLFSPPNGASAETVTIDAANNLYLAFSQEALAASKWTLARAQALDARDAQALDAPELRVQPTTPLLAPNAPAPLGAFTYDFRINR